ncbi:hypothetical protein AB3X91_16070 [Paraburkholderia sp. BR14263]|uniref:hypothetical protein n=1 Tax=unclassified Paraburkholderia TaxID=2615204 RepID=UPI0034CF13B1
MSREIPDQWIEKLFAKMETIYGGAAFRAMWGGVDADEMKATWKQGLSAASLTDDGLRRGVSALFHTKRTPNLPEFITLCAPQPPMYRQHSLALTDESKRTSPEQACEQLARIREIAEKVLRDAGPVPLDGRGIRWAYRLLSRATNGGHIAPHQITFAKEAIANWKLAHGVHDNGHEREPGADDE